MPHKTIWEDHGICMTFSGIVTTQELLDSNGEVYRDPRFSDLKYFIWDATNVKKLDFGKRGADIAANTDKVSTSWKPHMRLALVANDPGSLI